MSDPSEMFHAAAKETLLDALEWQARRISRLEKIRKAWRADRLWGKLFARGFIEFVAAEYALSTMALPELDRAALLDWAKNTLESPPGYKTFEKIEKETHDEGD